MASDGFVVVIGMLVIVNLVKPAYGLGFVKVG
jgi:hypothetical protein